MQKYLDKFVLALHFKELAFSISLLPKFNILYLFHLECGDCLFPYYMLGMFVVLKNEILWNFLVGKS